MPFPGKVRRFGTVSGRSWSSGPQRKGISDHQQQGGGGFFPFLAMAPTCVTPHRLLKGVEWLSVP